MRPSQQRTMNNYSESGNQGVSEIQKDNDVGDELSSSQLKRIIINYPSEEAIAKHEAEKQKRIELRERERQRRLAGGMGGQISSAYAAPDAGQIQITSNQPNNNNIRHSTEFSQNQLGNQQYYMENASGLSNAQNNNNNNNNSFQSNQRQLTNNNEYRQQARYQTEGSESQQPQQQEQWLMLKGRINENEQRRNKQFAYRQELDKQQQLRKQLDKGEVNVRPDLIGLPKQQQRGQERQQYGSQGEAYIFGGMGEDQVRRKNMQIWEQQQQANNILANQMKDPFKPYARQSTLGDLKKQGQQDNNSGVGLFDKLGERRDQLSRKANNNIEQKPLSGGNEGQRQLQVSESKVQKEKEIVSQSAEEYADELMQNYLLEQRNKQRNQNNSNISNDKKNKDEYGGNQEEIMMNVPSYQQQLQQYPERRINSSNGRRDYDDNRNGNNNSNSNMYQQADEQRRYDQYQYQINSSNLNKDYEDQRRFTDNRNYDGVQQINAQYDQGQVQYLNNVSQQQSQQEQKQEYEEYQQQQQMYQQQQFYSQNYNQQQQRGQQSQQQQQPERVVSAPQQFDDQTEAKMRAREKQRQFKEELEKQMAEKAKIKEEIKRKQELDDLKYQQQFIQEITPKQKKDNNFNNNNSNTSVVQQQEQQQQQQLISQDQLNPIGDEYSSQSNQSREFQSGNNKPVIIDSSNPQPTSFARNAVFKRETQENDATAAAAANKTKVERLKYAEELKQQIAEEQQRKQEEKRKRQLLDWKDEQNYQEFQQQKQKINRNNHNNNHNNNTNNNKIEDQRQDLSHMQNNKQTRLLNDSNIQKEMKRENERNRSSYETNQDNVEQKDTDIIIAGKQFKEKNNTDWDEEKPLRQNYLNQNDDRVNNPANNNNNNNVQFYPNMMMQPLNGIPPLNMNPYFYPIQFQQQYQPQQQQQYPNFTVPMFQGMQQQQQQQLAMREQVIMEQYRAQLQTLAIQQQQQQQQLQQQLQTIQQYEQSSINNNNMNYLVQGTVQHQEQLPTIPNVANTIKELSRAPSTHDNINSKDNQQSVIISNSQVQKSAENNNISLCLPSKTEFVNVHEEENTLETSYIKDLQAFKRIQLQGQDQLKAAGEKQQQHKEEEQPQQKDFRRLNQHVFNDSKLEEQLGESNQSYQTVEDQPNASISRPPAAYGVKVNQTHAAQHNHSLSNNRQQHKQEIQQQQSNPINLKNSNNNSSIRNSYSQQREEEREQEDLKLTQKQPQQQQQQQQQASSQFPRIRTMYEGQVSNSDRGNEELEPLTQESQIDITQIQNSQFSEHFSHFVQSKANEGESERVLGIDTNQQGRRSIKDKEKCRDQEEQDRNEKQMQQYLQVPINNINSYSGLQEAIQMKVPPQGQQQQQQQLPPRIVRSGNAITNSQVQNQQQPQQQQQQQQQQQSIVSSHVELHKTADYYKVFKEHIKDEARSRHFDNDDDELDEVDQSGYYSNNNDSEELCDSQNVSENEGQLSQHMQQQQQQQQRQSQLSNYSHLKQKQQQQQHYSQPNQQIQKSSKTEQSDGLGETQFSEIKSTLKDTEGQSNQAAHPVVAVMTKMLSQHSKQLITNYPNEDEPEDIILDNRKKHAPEMVVFTRSDLENNEVKLKEPEFNTEQEEHCEIALPSQEDDEDLEEQQQLNYEQQHSQFMQGKYQQKISKLENQQQQQQIIDEEILEDYQDMPYSPSKDNENQDEDEEEETVNSMYVQSQDAKIQQKLAAFQLEIQQLNLKQAQNTNKGINNNHGRFQKLQVDRPNAIQHGQQQQQYQQQQVSKQIQSSNKSNKEVHSLSSSENDQQQQQQQSWNLSNTVLSSATNNNNNNSSNALNFNSSNNNNYMSVGAGQNNNPNTSSEKRIMSFKKPKTIDVFAKITSPKIQNSIGLGSKVALSEAQQGNSLNDYSSGSYKTLDKPLKEEGQIIKELMLRIPSNEALQQQKGRVVDKEKEYQSQQKLEPFKAQQNKNQTKNNQYSLSNYASGLNVLLPSNIHSSILYEKPIEISKGNEDISRQIKQTKSEHMQQFTDLHISPGRFTKKQITEDQETQEKEGQRNENSNSAVNERLNEKKEKSKNLLSRLDNLLSDLESEDLS